MQPPVVQVRPSEPVSSRLRRLELWPQSSLRRALTKITAARLTRTLTSARRVVPQRLLSAAAAAREMSTSRVTFATKTSSKPARLAGPSKKEKPARRQPPQPHNLSLLSPLSQCPASLLQCAERPLHSSSIKVLPLHRLTLESVYEKSPLALFLNLPSL